MIRNDGRKPNQHRNTRITPGFMPNAEGSALIEIGDTKVICTASLGWRRVATLAGLSFTRIPFSRISRSTFVLSISNLRLFSFIVVISCCCCYLSCHYY